MDPEVATISKQTEIPVSEIPPSKPHHPFHKTQVLLIAFFLVLVIAAFFAGAYYQGMNTKKEASKVATTSPTPLQPTPTVDPTADWKMYVDEAYAYSFKYPEKFYTVNVLPDDLKKYGVLQTVHLEDSVYDDRAPVWIRVLDASGKTITTLEERNAWCAEMTKKLDGQSGQLSCDLDGDFKEVTLNGEQAFRASGSRDNRIVALYYIPNKKYIVAIEATTAILNDAYPQQTAIPMTDQILKTFTFIKPVEFDLTKWKTYTNPLLGYSFQYRPDLLIKENKGSVSLRSLEASEGSGDPREDWFEFDVIEMDNADSNATQDYLKTWETTSHGGPGVAVDFKPYKNGEVSGKIGDTGTETQNQTVIQIKDNTLYIFLLGGGPNTGIPPTDSAKKTFELLLSTFHFATRQ